MLAKKHNLSPAFLRRRRTQSGQSVLIALAVLFLLGFLGALFSIIVVRNLANAQNQTNTLTTDYFAQAGINYANSQLESSPQGADWRPPLQYTWTSTPPTYLTSGEEPSLPNDDINDPDYKWLSAGFSRYNLNGGRFLIRLDYDPGAVSLTNPSATAKYIEIESIGRLGTIDANDPTTYVSNPPDYRRSELVAYKPIGIVDYSRFITNKDNRTDTANLGVPSVLGSTGVVTPGVQDLPLNTTTPVQYALTTTYGSPSAYNSLVTSGTAGGGGSLRSNMNLRLYGENSVYLNTVAGDDWEVAGNILLDNYNAATAGTSAGYSQELAQCTFNTSPSAATLATTLSTMDSLYPSNDTINGFNSFGGAVRDGSTSSDAYGYPRSIRRLNPPTIDSLDAVTGLSRYQELANGSELQTQQWSNTAADFLPATVYVNNTSDIQSESPNAVGGSSLRDNWLDTSSAYWAHGFYSPPGTTITFGQVPAAKKITDINDPYGITITRSDSENGALASFTSGGTSPTAVGQTLYLSYESPPTGTTANPSTSAVGYLDVDESPTMVPAGGTTPQYKITPPNDVVIYASGNVRVRGLISNAAGLAKHITLVTNGIAYIDGSILKGNTSSSIAILARQYVCVNTSQLLAGAPDFTSSVTTDPSSGGPLTFSGSGVLSEADLFDNPYPSATLISQQTYNLYVSESSPGNSEGDITVDGSLLKPAAVQGTTPENSVSPITSIQLPPATPFDLTFTKDAQYSDDWVVESAAVLPANIDIQAVLYAQDDSFFVIPGDWFNPNKADNLSNFANHSTTLYDPNGDFPFYGQPIDMKITIDGAVSENVPANISDQAAWMQKWGWIPRYHGSDQKFGLSPHAPTAAGVGIGLNISYDYNAGFPYVAGPVGSYLRQDRFGRPLPFAPALPVSPDLLYSGQPPT